MDKPIDYGVFWYIIGTCKEEYIGHLRVLVRYIKWEGVKAMLEVGAPFAAGLPDKIYRESVSMPLNQIVGVLQEQLSRRLTAYIAGVKDTKTVARWASGDVVGIRLESERRLRTAYQITSLITQFDSPRTARAWFVGLNPQLNDVSPAEALHEGRLQESLSAARAYITGG